MMAMPHDEHLCKTVLLLRSLRPEHRPSTTKKLASHLQRTGCCKVRTRVQPGELACALAAGENPQCRNFAQPFAAAVRAHGKNMVSETSALALDCAKSAAIRFLQLPDEFVQSICGPRMQVDQAAQWLCAQSSSVVSIHPAKLVEELCRRGYLAGSAIVSETARDAAADMGRLVYDEARLAEQPPGDGIDGQPWNHRTWLGDLLGCEASKRALEAACPKAGPQAKSNESDWLPTWPFFSHDGQQVKLLSSSLGCILKTDIVKKRIKVIGFRSNPLPSLEVLRALQLVVSPNPAFQCRFGISTGFKGSVLGKRGATLRLLQRRFGVRLMVVASNERFDKTSKVTDEIPQVKQMKQENAGLSWAAIAARGATSPPGLTGSNVPLRKVTSGPKSMPAPEYKLVGWLGAEVFARSAMIFARPAAFSHVVKESGSLAALMQEQAKQKAEQLTQELKDMFESYSARHEYFAQKKKQKPNPCSGRRQTRRSFKNHIAQQQAWFDGGA